MIGPTSGDIVVVLTTFSSLEDAQRIADRLIEEKVAGCVQIDGPLHSVYRWKGEVCRETEYRCVIKTIPTLLGSLESLLKEIHPFQVPQFIVLQGMASTSYYSWLLKQIQ
jgi:periplasmic divalent cation tolerance protein